MQFFETGKKSSFEQLARDFRWSIPDYFNIAEAVCDRHRSIASRTALYCEDESGNQSIYSFGELSILSSRFANALRGHGITRGDRVAIVLPQRVETAIAHLAAWKVGAITVPLSVLFGPDALEFRLRDSGSKMAICDGAHQEKLESVGADLDQLESIVSCDAAGAGGFWGMLERGAEKVEIVNTRSDDPATIIYTSGTTGPPKGALVAHRCLLGNLPGFELSHNFFPQQDDLFWTPADWAWTGGLIDALLPSLYYGVPVLGYNGGKFDPERICELIGRYRVRNAFVPPTALKMMRQLSDVRNRYGVCLRSVMSAGESMGAELYHWGNRELGIQINEMWAQSEFNYIAGNCSALMTVRPGSLGKAYPGHRVAPVDQDGNELPTGVSGELAAFRDDPVMFLGYWNRRQATEDKFIGQWWGTGDIGYRDEDGYLWFVGRKDDVISSAGYRIGPGEIEDCLIKHPAVRQAAVVGSPDELRGEIVKAFIVLTDGHNGSEALKKEIQDSVRNRLAAYEYPRAIEFLQELPLTTTGKVRRLELRQREQKKEV